MTGATLSHVAASKTRGHHLTGGGSSAAGDFVDQFTRDGQSDCFRGGAECLGIHSSEVTNVIR